MRGSMMTRGNTMTADGKWKQRGERTKWTQKTI